MADPDEVGQRREPAPKRPAGAGPADRPDAMFRSMFENAPTGQALHRIVADEAGRPVDYVFLEVNPAFERLTGLKRANLIGRRATEAIPGFERDPADWIATFGRVALHGERVRFRQYSETLQRWYDVTAYAPEPGSFAVVFSDASDHLALETALRDSEIAHRMQWRQLEAVLNATHAQLALLDDQMRFVMVNEAYERACGHTREELIGGGHFEFFPNAENERIFRRVAATGEPFYITEKPFEFADQPERGVSYWNWSLVPVKSAAGGVQGVLLSLLDVSAQVGARVHVEQLAAERQLAVDALAEEAQLRDRFVAILSHDLRSPLTTLATTLKLLSRHLTQAGDAEALARAERATQSMQSLVATLLDYSRLRVGQSIPIDPKPCDLGEIATRVVEDRKLAAPDRCFVVETAGDLKGTWDPERLVQVFSNLLANAVKYGAPTVPIRVRLDGGSERVRAEVNNGGEPIPPEVIATLFVPFRRGPSETVGARPGLGLGLYIVGEIARAHGAEVDVRSSAQEGTTFSVQLPRRCAARS